MIAVITPDGSLVFSSPEHSVHIDARRRTVQVEERSGPDTGAVSIRESFFVDEVSFERSPEAGPNVYLRLLRPGGEPFELGLVPSGGIAEQLIDALEAVSGASVRVVDRPRPYHEQETRRLDYPRGALRLPSVRIDDLLDDLEIDIEVMLEDDAPRPAPETLGHGEQDPTIPIELRPRFASTP